MSTTKAVLLAIGIVAVIVVVVAGGWALKAGMLPFMTGLQQFTGKVSRTAKLLRGSGSRLQRTIKDG